MPGQGTRIDFVTGAPEKYANLVDAMSVLPGRYRAALANASDATIRRELSATDWSAYRNLAHVLFVTEANEVFIRQMATMSEPTRKSFPVGIIAEELETLSVPELSARLEAAIGRTVDLLGHTPDAAWGRPGYVRGLRRSLRQMVVGNTAHLVEHLDNITKLVAP